MQINFIFDWSFMVISEISRFNCYYTHHLTNWTPSFWWITTRLGSLQEINIANSRILLMEDILYQLIWYISHISHYVHGLYIPGGWPDFFHQQYVGIPPFSPLFLLHLLSHPLPASPKKLMPSTQGACNRLKAPSPWRLTPEEWRRLLAFQVFFWGGSGCIPVIGAMIFCLK